MSFDGQTIRFSATGINAKNTGATTIGTTPNNGKQFIVTRVIVECTAASAISVAPVVSVGQNSASYNDIATAVAALVVGANTVNIAAPLAGVAVSVAPNTAIKANVSVAATGTSQTLNVHVEGFYSA